MNRQAMLILKVLVVILSINIGFTNCDWTGGSHSPQNEQLQGGSGVGNPLAPTTNQMVAAACAVIPRCHPEVTPSSCESAVQAATGLDYQIGVPSGHFSNFKSIMDAEQQGSLSGSSDAIQQCTQIVSSLTCDSPQAAGAYIATQKNPFWGIPRLFLQSECAQVFKKISSLSLQKLHYIHFGASGRGDGSDWLNACPGFVGACAGDKMLRGHTYFVSSGTYGDVNFNVPGTDLITVKKATQSEHGNDTGWLPNFDAGAAIFSTWTFSSSHWVIDGQNRLTATSGQGFQIQPPANCPRNNCNAILLDSSSDVDRVTLRYVEVVGFGVNSNRHLNGFYSVPATGSSSNIVLYGISMHDFGIYNGNSPIKTSGNGVTNLTFDNSSIVRSAARAISDTGSQNVTIRNSWFENLSDQGIVVVSGSNPSPNWSIYGNIFWESDPSTFGIDYGAIECTNQNDCINWQITNNTFAGFTSARTRISAVNFHEAGPNSAGNRLLNNIWLNSANVDSGGVNITSDYNMYVSSTGLPDNENFGVFTEVDPFVNSSVGDFHLAAPTEPGLRLASPLNLGREDKLRGYNGVWDRGAFEF